MQNRLVKPLRGWPGRHPLFRVLLAGTAAAVVSAGGASAAASSRFRIQVHIANHTPIAGRRWPIELVVTRGAKRLSGTVRYQFLFAGVVVRTQPQHGAFKFKHGVYLDQLIFPVQSIGQPLTLRFLVRTRYGLEHADWALETQSQSGDGNSQ